MQIVYCKKEDRFKWNNFVKENALDGGILQSWEWGEFQESLGRKIWRLVLVDDDKIISSILVVKYPLPFMGSYLYVPRGPIKNAKCKMQNAKLLKLLLEEIEKIGRKERAIFLRMDPAVFETKEDIEALRELGFVKSSKETQPKCTLILDISLSEDELFSQMKPKTRYNIRLAQKKGIEVRGQTSGIFPSFPRSDLWEMFWQLLQETAKRDGFRTHPKRYYQKMMRVLGKRREIRNKREETRNKRQEKAFVKLFLAEYKKEILAANLIGFFGERVYYLHGASSDKYRNLMAPYLLHWETIKEAKRLGYKYYDLWGIMQLPTSNFQLPTSNAWQGITRFKKGFAPMVPAIEYIGTWEFPLKPWWYRIYQLARRIKYGA